MPATDFADSSLETILPPDNAFKPAVDPIIPPVDPVPPVETKKVDEPPVKVVDPVPPVETRKPPESDALVNPHLAEEQKPKKEETAAGDDDEKETAGMTTKAKTSWKALRQSEKAAITERDAERKTVAELKQQLAAADTTKAEREQLAKDLAESKARLKEYEDEISITRVEATALFKDRVTKPQAEIVAGAEELAKRYEIPSETILKAIQEPDATKRSTLLEELLTDFKHVDQIEVAQAAKDWQRIQKAAAELRTDASKKLAEITKQQDDEKLKRDTGTVQDYRNAAKERWEAMQQLVPVLRKVDGKDKWNAYVDAKGRELEAVDVNNLPVGDVAEMAAAKIALPEVLGALTHFQADNKKLREELAAANARLKDYLATAPGAGGGNGNGDGGKRNGAAAAGGSFEDAVAVDLGR